MNLQKLSIAAALCALPLSAYSDTIGFRLDAYSWQQQFEGDIQSGGEAIDLEDTLGIDDETNNVFSARLEHPVPLIPNIAITRTELEVDATETLNESFTFDGVTYNVNETVTTDADLSHTDATLYYEILDNWVSVDVGLTVRFFDEGVQISSSTENAELDLDGALPLLYGAVKFELPLSGLYASADANWISYQDSSILDYKVNLGYETAFGLGVEAGLRTFDIDYEDEDDSSEQADVTIDGAYLGVFYHF